MTGWRTFGPLRAYRASGLAIVQLRGVRLSASRSSLSLTWGHDADAGRC